MKKKLLLFLFIILILNENTSSQNNKFEFENNKDSIQIILKSLNKKAFLLKRNADSLKFYTDKILKISKEYSIPLYEIKAYGLLGLVNKLNNKFEKSMYFLHKAKHLSKKLNYEREYYRNLNDIAGIHNRTSYYDSAVYYYKKLDKYYSSKEIDRLPINKMHLANVYLKLDELDFAIINYNLSNIGLRLLKNKPTSLPLNRLVTGNLISISRAYSLKNNFNTSIKYADTALVLAKKHKLHHLLPTIYNKQRQNYNSLNNYLEADKYSELQALSDTVKINSKRLVRIPIENSKSLAKNINDRKERVRKIEKRKVFYKNSFFIISLIAFILAMFSLMIIRRRRKLKEKLKVTQKELIKLKERNNDQKEHIIINLKSKAVLNSSEILYIKSDGHYVEYFIDNKTNPEIDRNSLNEVLKILPSSIFIRIHKSFIVNIYRIKIINSTKVMLDNGVWINLSRTYKQKLKDILHKDD